VTPYYADDLVTLYLGDCREVMAWLSADVLVTDPPYGIARADSNSTQRPVEIVAGDENTDIRDAALALWGTRPAMVFGSWRQSRPQRVTGRLIWHKAAALSGHTCHAWYSAEEEIYLLGTGWVGKPIQNVIVTRERRDGAHGLVATIGHPTPKPVGLMEILIGKCPAGVIADPFAGAGSALIAARNLGRHAVGVELKERYCEVAAKRLCQDVLISGALG
jgi:site-specific DNA-methyltransferase (adenine-specific)